MRRKYPSFLSCNDLPGKYKNIGVEYHRSPVPHSVRFKLFYPSVPVIDTTKGNNGATGSNYPIPQRYFTDIENAEGLRYFLLGNPLKPNANSFGFKLYSLFLKLFLHYVVNTPQTNKQINKTNRKQFWDH